MSKIILTADDSASVRQMVSFTLREAGYEVIEAVDGKDALAKANSRTPHMVITDLNMPNLDGIGLIRASGRPRPVSSFPWFFDDRISGGKKAGRQSRRGDRLDCETF